MKKGDCGEREAGALALNIFIVASRAAELLAIRGVVIRSCLAAALVAALGATALGGGADRAWGANSGVWRTVLPNLARLTGQYVGREVPSAT